MRWGADDRILVFAGSISEGSSNRHLARNAAVMAAELRIPATHLDLRDYPLPLYDRDLVASTGIPRHAMALRTQLRRHPIWLIASPEHNGSVSALLKNAIDWVSCPVIGEGNGRFKHTVVGLLSSSREPRGRTVSLLHLRQILERLDAQVLDAEFVIGGGRAAFDEAGLLHDDAGRAALRHFIEQVHLAASAGSAQPAVASSTQKWTSRWLMSGEK